MSDYINNLIESILTAKDEMLKYQIEANSVTLNGRKYGKLIENLPPNMKPTILGMAAKVDYALPDEYDFLVQFEPPQPKTNEDAMPHKEVNKMGYYTSYDLGWANNLPEPKRSEYDERIIKRIKELTGLCGDEFLTDFWADELHLYFYAKWYDSANDMFVLSTEFPEIKFILDADGEERDDRWRELWFNGTYEHVDAVIPAFTSEKLKPYKPTKAFKPRTFCEIKDGCE